MRFDSSLRRMPPLALVCIVLAATASAAAASVLNVRDEGHLRFITSNGEPSVSARFTITGHSGSISGKAKGNLSNPTSPDPSFRGAFTITGGSGRYAHIHGTGELFGVFTRRGRNKYGLVVQAIGKLPY
jgi:hypothetical protein